MAAETAWPQVSQIGFTNFCQRSGLIDNVNLNVGDCDRMFIAARLEENAPKSKNIIRFMFFEGVVRVALKKYM